MLGSDNNDFLEPKFVTIESRFMRNRGGDGGIRRGGEPFDESYEVQGKTLMWGTRVNPPCRKPGRRTHLSIRNVPHHTAKKVLAFCDTGSDRLAFREFNKLGECNSGQRLLPCPLHLIFQPQLNGSCGRCGHDPRNNPKTVGVDNVQCVLK